MSESNVSSIQTNKIDNSDSNCKTNISTFENQYSIQNSSDFLKNMKGGCSAIVNDIQIPNNLKSTPVIHVPQSAPVLSQSENSFHGRYFKDCPSCDYVNKRPCIQQNGGGKLYEYIKNPKTGRQVKLNGKLGIQILRNYITILSGGDISIFDGNMNNRTFNCSQPKWTPDCI